MYLRGQDAIGEGDDLEFEHHLVTIEDFKGTVVQDLAPLFSPAVQRKQVCLYLWTRGSVLMGSKLQQIQVRNALLNSPTPNQANRHGPWGPSRYGAPTPQSVQQRRPIPATGSPQTPVQQRPICVPGLTLQQAARQAINYPAQAQDRFPRPAQQSPPSAPVNTAGPPPQLQSISHQTPQGDFPQSPTRVPRPRSNLVPPAQPNGRPPFHGTSGWLSSGGPNPPPPPAPFQKPQAPSTRPDHASSRTLQPCPNRRPPVALNLDTDTEPIQSQPDTRHPGSPPKQPQPNNDFLRHVPPRPNKHASGVTIDINNDLGPQPTPLPASLGPVPLSRQNNAFSDPPPPRATKRPPAALNSNRETRPFRPPSKRKSSGTPVPQTRLLEDFTALANKKDEIPSGSGEDAENESVIEPLISAGILRLNNSTSRKRNKLLCQRPPGTQSAVRSTVPSTKGNVAKKLRTDLDSKPHLPRGDVMVIGDEGDPGHKPATAETSTVNHQKSSNTSRALKVTGNSTESRENVKGKEKSSGPSSDQGYRVEKGDTLQYQRDNDIGPWSSEALDLFSWRPPGMEERK